MSKWPCVCVLPFIRLSVLRPGLCTQSCLLGLDFSSVTFHSATGDWGGGGLEVNEKQESESGLKMLRDQRGKVGRGRVWCWEEEQGEYKLGEDLFSYWLFKVVQFKNWINLIWLCFSARLDMLSFLALWIVQYIVCCKYGCVGIRL